MPDNIVSLSKAKLEREPHTAGPAKCLACGHEWVAVALIGDLALKCPSCHSDRGIRDGMILHGDEPHWTCNCGNSHFLITPNRVYCQNCGLDQKLEWD